MGVVDVTSAVGNYVDGLYYTQVNTSGVMIGPSGTAPTAGDQTGAVMSRLYSVQDLPFEEPEEDTPSQPGDGGVVARFINKPTELPEAMCTLGSSDYDFAALCKGQVVKTVAGGKGVLGGGYNPTFATMCYLAVSAAESIESGNTGGMWEGRLWFNVRSSYKGRTTFNTSSLPSYNVKMVANYATVWPWGTAMVNATDGDDKAVFWDFTWPYRPILQCWVSDGTETEYNLAKNIAVDNDNNIAVWINGVELTYGAGAPGAGAFGVTESTTDSIVLGAAGTSGHIIVALYGWQ